MDKLELLEDKIRKATHLIRSLREERDNLQGKIRRLETSAPDPALSEELARFSRERQMVAERIEQMISIIDDVEAP